MKRSAAASFLTILGLALAPAAFGETRGGAVPTGLSHFEATEFADVQWAKGRDAADPTWGSLVLEGDGGVHFTTDAGAEIVVPYSAIKSIKYERVVVQKEQPKNAKWYQRTLAFAKGVNTYRTVTIEHKSGQAREFSVMRVDDQSAFSIVRVLEIKTGLRAKKLSSY